jgi:hypothetical protein
MKRSVLSRRLRAVAGSSFVCLALLLTAATPAAAATSYFVDLSGPNNPDASGLAQVSIDVANGSVCVTWDIINLDPATFAHIQSGAEGETGPVVVTLPTPDEEGQGGDCVNGLDGAVLQAIVDDPDSYYVAVYTAQSETPAIRGQLGEPIEHFQLSVSALACVEGTPIEPFEGTPEGCRPVVRPENIIDLPDGYSWGVEPLAAPLDVEIDDGAGILTIADGEWEGGGTCNSVTLLCSQGGAFRWDLLLSGDTVVTQTGIPAGYVLAGAVLFEGLDGEALPLAGTGAVAFDSTGTDGLSLVLFDLPASAEQPTATVPPTSTLGSPSPSDGGSSGALLAALAIAATVGIGVSLAIPRRDPGPRQKDPLQ